MEPEMRIELTLNALLGHRTLMVLALQGHRTAIMLLRLCCL